MKKMIFSVLCLVWFSVVLAQGSAQLAGKYYQQGKYRAALQEYLSLEKNADIYYNIGNCYYRLQDFGLAVLYYKRALRLKPASWQITGNLRLLQDKLQDKPVEKDFWEKRLQRLSTFLSLNMLALIILLTVALGVLAWLGGVYRPWLNYLAGALFLLVLGLGYFAYHQSQVWQKEAVLIAEQAQGYSGPGRQHQELFVVHAGNVFSVLESKDSWSKIRLEQGFVGWIKSEKLEKI